MFQINEEALIKGSALLTKLAINTLNELKKGEK